MKPITTIIYDFDGTLADTGHLIVNSKLKAFEALNMPVPDYDFVDSLSGMGLRDSLVLASGSDSIATINELAALYHQIFLEASLRDAKLFDGVEEILEYYHSRGIKQALVSVRPTAIIKKLVKTTGIENYFFEIIGEDYVDHPKPAPDMAEYLMAISESMPDRTVVVGDTIMDVEMGREAGTITVGATFGVTPLRIMALEKPDFMIDNITALKEIVK